MVDFDDLLVKTVQLLQENPGIAEFYQRHFQFILVDEYQDTNKIQSEFIDLLARRHQSVMVVGDDAQSIYSWRGANYENILDFPKRYPNARIYRIEINYRSVPEIVALANADALRQPPSLQYSIPAGALLCQSGERQDHPILFPQLEAWPQIAACKVRSRASRPFLRSIRGCPEQPPPERGTG